MSSESTPTATGSLLTTAKRAVAKFTKEGATDLAAALTYYSVLSLFPAILALTSLLGVLGRGPDTTRELITVLEQLGVAEGQLTTISTYIDRMQGTGGASWALVIGIVAALWAASNYVNAFSRAMNKIYDVVEGRPIWVLRPVMLVLTLVMLLLVMLIALSLALSGTVAEAVFGVVGLSAEATRVWGLAKWPVMFVVIVIAVGILYWGTPNLKRRFRLISPGALVAIVVMVVALGGFGFYISMFGNYEATYGVMAGAILMLLLLWVINLALLFGAAFDAEFERSRQLLEGLPAEEFIQLPPRDSRNAEKKARKQHEIVEENRRIRVEAGRAREAEASADRAT